MPHQSNLRKGRHSKSGLYYFITTGTRGRLPIFTNPAAATIVLECLKWLDEQGRIHLIAAVVMPDHVHFVAQLLETTLPSLMHSLKSYSAKRVNDALGRAGQLWEPQYYDHALRSHDELRESVRYCLENPLRRGLVEDFKTYPYLFCIYEI